MLSFHFQGSDRQMELLEKEYNRKVKHISDSKLDDSQKKRELLDLDREYKSKADAIVKNLY